VKINEGWFDPVQDRIGNVEKSRSPRPAQKLASRARQNVTADHTHIDGHLTNRLAGVEHVDQLVLACDTTHRFCRVHQSPLRGDMGEGDKTRARLDHPLQRIHVDLPCAIRRYEVHMQSAAGGLLKKREIVRSVF
jgi:hypothetical protein